MTERDDAGHPDAAGGHRPRTAAEVAAPDGRAPAQVHEDLRAAERRAAGDIEFSGPLVAVLVASVVLLVTFFLPHSGPVLGFDVLLDTDTARFNHTTPPERLYTIFLVITILLGFATFLSRSAVVAFVGWVFACVTAVYSMFAGWMRQTRPLPQDDGGISWGLIIGMIAAVSLAVAISAVVFRRSTLQAALELARREQAGSDPVLRAQQQYLRSGLTPLTSTDLAIVDDRRERSRRRRAARAEAERAAREDDAAGEGA
ncbi:Rv2732c family membrane protein [Corynebacterium sphenisci]|uniref:Rv2732c family membrane protein n=1 Tax=Corynebacterium sphenisci TaxID=191493 RepID=UPI0026E00B44|nr:hypothetical protein [Corynebacterium sphenisci]MDO5730914.1 hypothetical protein [Corynebacterium sphenisci]